MERAICGVGYKWSGHVYIRSIHINKTSMEDCGIIETRD